MNWYVGQRVVAIKDCEDGMFKKGEEFKIHALRDGICKCSPVLICVGFTTQDKNSWCAKCNNGIHQINNGYRWHLSIRFAPLDTTESDCTVEQLINELEICESESENIGVPIYAPEYG